MRTALAALALVVAADAASAREEQSGFPLPLQGLWAISRSDCTLLKQAPASVPTGRGWLRITPEAVAGSSNGRFIRTTGPRSAEATDNSVSTITVAYSLLRDGRLDEGVVGAQASTQYIRCR